VAIYSNQKTMDRYWTRTRLRGQTQEWIQNRIPIQETNNLHPGMLREKPADWQQNQNENQSKAKRNQTGKIPGFFHKLNRGKIELTGRRSGHALDLEKTRKGSRSYKREHERARRRATMDGASPLPRCTRTSSCLRSHRLVPLDNRRFYFPPIHIGRCFQTVASFTVCCVVLMSIGSGGIVQRFPTSYPKLSWRGDSTMRTHTCFTRVIPGGFNHLAYQVVFFSVNL
jgi:hypothetical protein